MRCLRYIQAWFTAQCLAVFELLEQGHSAIWSTAREVTLVSDSTPPPVGRPGGCHQLSGVLGESSP